LEERLRKTIASVGTWPELKELEKNIKSRGGWTEETGQALRHRSTEIAIPFIQERTGLDLGALTPAERKIVEAVGEYVGIMREQGKYPGRTLEQLKNRKLLGAAEVAVAKKRPTQGFQTLADANLEDLSYERIVVDHPEEFSARALWFSRRTLGIENRWSDPPSPPDGKRQQITETLLAWLAARAAAAGGVIEPFGRREHIAAAGYDEPQAGGIATGAAQSRLDFACFQLGLPPLGLTAQTPFPAWEYDGKAAWAFPLASMTREARERRWTPEELERVLDTTRRLPEVGPLWKSPELEEERRRWASLFGSTVPGQDSSSAAKHAARPERDEWLSDELILVLDLDVRSGGAPLEPDSVEIQELEGTLGKLREVLGDQRPESVRDVAAIRAKLGDFRRIQAADGTLSVAGASSEDLVWSEFGSDPAKLSEVAAAIRACLQSPDAPRGAWPLEPEEQFGEEGKLLSGLHRYRERDPALSRRKKEQVLQDTGKLACEACGLDSERKYGKAGIGIEAHHLEPLHTLAAPKVPRLDDVALLCATCHRVLHAHRPWLTVARLRELVQGQAPR
jgi:hypothetical protein